MKKILNEKFIDAESMGASFTSSALNLYEYPGHAIQLVFTGTPNGSFKLQTSLDSGTSWSDVADSAQAISAAGDHLWTVSDRYKLIRVVYTRSSGTGSCDGLIFAVREN